MKTITLTQKQLDEKLGEARKEGYDIAKRELLYPANRRQSIAVAKIVDALFELLDSRYEFKHGDD